MRISRDVALGLTLISTLLFAPACADDEVFDADCSGGVSGVPCDDQNPCTRDDFCEEFICQGSPVEDQTSCDDGDQCTLDDRCVAGVCDGLFVCADDPAHTADPSCLGEPAGEPCDDGDLCTVSDVCDGDGACAGEAKSCPDEAGGCVVGSCDPESGVCVSEVALDATSCDDGDPCTVDTTCSSGACGGASFAPAGSPCDDGDEDTFGDSCLLGVCSGDPVLCDPACCDVADGMPCSDGNLCTQDVCQDGFCVGTACPVDCADFDGAQGCLVGICDPTTGACSAQALPSGAVCDDGDPCTVNDACQAGSCQGMAMDCSEVEGPCTAGACDPETGDCLPTHLETLTPCNDGDACTGHDACTAGSCVGTFDLCGACAGKLAGDVCDDGDPCAASTGICVQVAGGLRCEAPQKDCSSSATVCSLGVCDPDSGACVQVARPDGAACDDGDTCTSGDQCIAVEGSDAPVCSGTFMEMCGDAAPAFCEPAVVNNSLAQAIPVALEADDIEEGPESFSLRLLGTLTKAGDEDWFVINVDGDEQIDVVTSSHCLSDLTTVIYLVRPTGEQLTIPASSGGFASILGDRAGAAGSYYIGIGAETAEGKNTYLLDIRRQPAPPCVTDEDCGCDQLECASGGAVEGTCVAKIPVELEPNGSSGVATPFPDFSDSGASVLGRLGTTNDADWYALELDGVTPVTLTTHTSCDEAEQGQGIVGGGGEAPPAPEDAVYACDDVAAEAEVETVEEEEPTETPEDVSTWSIQTELALFAADGVSEMALSHTNEAGGGEAGLYDLLVPSAGTYYVRVRGQAGSMGAYTLHVEETACETAADCGCSDQICGNLGACVPKLSAPEPVAQLTEDYELTLGVRLHGVIDAPYDTDSYAITLGEGTYEFVTESFCGSSVQTRLALYGDGEDGEPVLIQEANSGGEGPFAAITDYEIGAAQSLDVVVRAEGAAMGSYILFVRAIEEGGQ